MDQLHKNFSYTASSVALDNQGRVQDLGRGSCLSSELQSPPTHKCRKLEKLRILQCNINGLCSMASKIRLDKLLELSEQHQVSIIALQETKLNARHRLRSKGYNIVRQDRPSKSGGGLIFLVRNVNYQALTGITSCNSDLESHGIRFLSKNRNINIIHMYQPPNNQNFYLAALEELFKDSSVLLGDLNAKHVA
ncbi:RNA-directed DNA polymerase from mobile element jockey [Trichonephila clavata]|uniref:RNA-directed DNA polymerase from mobile element jockey n=1 Tax=Trichonephila clavata TaxID=2740835 RepID=A0A8X6GY87_TRICU|nr:RNA-directed DNA polymerase from mobile element jockey [Trichonephila clavata]